MEKWQEFSALKSVIWFGVENVKLPFFRFVIVQSAGQENGKIQRNLSSSWGESQHHDSDNSDSDEEEEEEGIVTGLFHFISSWCLQIQSLIQYRMSCIN